MKGPSSGRLRVDPTRERRKQDRRAQLLGAAIRAVEREGPAVSVETIAAEAGITRPVLYRHFGDKAGLYQAVVDAYTGAVAEALAPALSSRGSPRRALVRTIEAYLDFLAEHRQLYRFAQWARAEQTGAHVAVRSYVSSLADALTDTLGTMLEAAGLDPALAEPWSYGIVGLVHLVGDWWIEDPEPRPRAQVAADLVDLLWEGLSRLESTGAPGGHGSRRGGPKMPTRSTDQKPGAGRRR